MIYLKHLIMMIHFLSTHFICFDAVAFSPWLCTATFWGTVTLLVSWWRKQGLKRLHVFSRPQGQLVAKSGLYPISNFFLLYYSQFFGEHNLLFYMISKIFCIILLMQKKIGQVISVTNSIFVFLTWIWGPFFAFLLYYTDSGNHLPTSNR